MQKKLLMLVALVTLSLQGCASYHAMPLTPQVAARALTPPSLSVLRVEAKQIKHPLLKPIALNAKNGLNPKEAAILAVLINPQLRAERDNRGVSAAQLYQAGILPNPQLSASLDIPSGGSTQGTVNAFGLGLSYNLYALVTRSARVQAARAHAAEINLRVAWQEWQVAEAAELHTYRLFLLQKQLAVATREEEGLKENLQVVQHAVALRDMTVINLSAARASLEKVHVAVLNIEQNLHQERVALDYALGFPPQHVVHLQRNISLPDTAAIPSLKQLLTGLGQRRLDLIALKQGYNSQEAKVRAAILGQFPQISLGFSHARDTGNVITTGPALTISLPFFNHNQGQIAIQRATRKKLFDEYLARLFQAQSNVAEFYTNIRSISQKIAATKEYLPTLRHLVKTYYQALLEGNADALTYYNVRDELIATHIALLSLQLQLVNQYIALEIAAGQYLGPVQQHKEPA